MHLAPGAAALDVGQHALQVADARGELLHVAQALVHPLQAIGHQPERFAEARLQRLLQLLVDGDAHLLELRCVLASQKIEALLQRLAHRLQALVVRHTELLQPVGGGTSHCDVAFRGMRELVLRELRESPDARVEVAELLLRRIGEAMQMPADLAAQRLGRRVAFAAQCREVELQVALESLALRSQDRDVGRQEAHLLRRRHERAKTPEDEEQQRDQDQEHTGADQRGPEEIIRHGQSLHARTRAPWWLKGLRGSGPSQRMPPETARHVSQRSRRVAPRGRNAPPPPTAPRKSAVRRATVGILHDSFGGCRQRTVSGVTTGFRGLDTDAGGWAQLPAIYAVQSPGARELDFPAFRSKRFPSRRVTCECSGNG